MAKKRPKPTSKDEPELREQHGAAEEADKTPIDSPGEEFAVSDAPRAGDGEPDATVVDVLDDDLTDPESLIGDEEAADDEEAGDEANDEASSPVRPSTTKRVRGRTLDDRSTTNRREDPVKTYLREIGKVPLLTKEGEVSLAKAMEIGVFAELSMGRLAGEEAAGKLKKSKGLSSAEESGLEELVEKGQEAAELLESSAFEEKLGAELPVNVPADQLKRLISEGLLARDRLTVSNLRLVVSIAKRYMNRGLSFLDLIQEGNMGLMKAVEKFDFSRGYKFSTYATWWIRQAITRAIADQSRTIRVPVHMIETVRELNRVKREFIQSHGSAPTLEDLSGLTGMSIDKIKKVESVSQYTASLERPIGDQDEDTLGDFIEDPASPSPTKETFRMFLKEQLARALDQLDEREREILKLRYGLDDGHPRTLKDVSLKFNITRERVRQIEIKAIEKLKHPSRRAELKKFRELLLAEE